MILARGHKRLDHPSPKILQSLKNHGKINFPTWSKISSLRISCQLGKRCKLPFDDSKKIAEFPLQKNYCDFSGPTPLKSNQNFRYYGLFIDDCMKFSWLFPLKQKANFFACFPKFQKQVEINLKGKKFLIWWRRQVQMQYFHQTSWATQHHSTKFLAHIHLNKMEWLKENTAI